jgi:putative RecB family exonuclease
MEFDGDLPDADPGTIVRLDEQPESIADVDHGVGTDPADDRGAQVPRYLSPSSSSMFQQCPRKWKHRYLDGYPDPPGEPALAGTFAHRVLELLLQEAPEARTRERARALARDVWPETAQNPEFVALALDDDAERAFRWRGWQAIEGLWAIEDPTSVEVAATEQDVRVTIDRVPFRGIIDRVDTEPDGLVIADYKSGRAPSERFAEDRLKQVLLYAAALTEVHGRRPVRARLLYLNQRIVEVGVTEANLGEAVDELRDTWEALLRSCEADTFEAHTGPLCAWCPFVAHCPEGRAEVEQRHLAGRVRADAPALTVLAAAS